MLQLFGHFIPVRQQQHESQAGVLRGGGMAVGCGWRQQMACCLNNQVARR